METVPWTRLRPVVEGALERSPSEREAFLVEACAGEVALLARARELLALEGQAGGILDDGREDTPLGASARPGSAARRAGDRLGSWRLERELGRGGMGAVWLAARADEAFTKHVALKLVRAGLDGEAVLERFGREQRLLASLEHPGIARLIDVGRDEHERPYLVMEYVEGVPIDTWCRERGLDLRARVRLFLGVCAAVEHAHAHLVVHRDLKPGNVLVDDAGKPKLLDFGIAKVLGDDPEVEVDLTRTGQQVYTPHYASPEQVRGEPIGTASDVYSLGVLLFELLTGELPYRFESGSPTEILRVIGERDPRRPSEVVRTSTAEGSADGLRRSRQLSGDLDAIVLTALRKEPERRYASVEALAGDLRRFLDGQPVLARPDTAFYRTAKFLRRHGVPVAAVAGLVLVLAAGLAGTTSQFLRAEAGWAAEADQNRLAGERLQTLERLSEDLAAERTAAVARADELARLADELADEKVVAERRFAEVRRFATALIFDVQREILPLAGATRARELVVRLGLEHLDRLASEAEGNDELLIELAGAYMTMGDVLGEGIGFNMGRTSEAITAYERGLALARGVEADAAVRLRERPLVAELGRKLADALHAVGQIEREREVLEATLAELEDLYRAPDASSPDLVSAMASMGRVAKLDMEAGRLDASEALLADVTAICERLLARHPDEASAWVEMGEALREQALLWDLRDRPERALELLEAACRHMDEAVARSGDIALARRHWYAARNALGTQLIRLKQPVEGLWMLEESLEWIERLAAEDPANQTLRRDLATVLRRIGNAYLELDDPASALETFSRSREVFARAAADEPENLALAQGVLLARVEEGRALARQARAEDALAAFEEAIEPFEALVAGRDRSPELLRTLLHVHRWVAEECARLTERKGLRPAHGEALREAAHRSVGRGFEVVALLRKSASATPYDDRLSTILVAVGAMLEASAGPSSPDAR